MRNRSTHALVGLIAVLVMAVGVSSASANRLSISHLLSRAIWSTLEFKGGLGAARCPVTLAQSFHSATVAKVIGALIGRITGATAGSCPSGGMTILRETLPWHIQYGGFTGALPFFTGVKLNLIGIAFKLSESSIGISCLARSTQENPSVGIVEGISWNTRTGNGVVSRLVAEGGARIPCGEFRGSFEGTANVTDNTGVADVLIQLI